MDGHIKELHFQVLDDDEGQAPLKLAVGVDEEEDTGDVVPDHRHDIAEDEDCVQRHFQAYSEHLEGQLVERVVL